MEGVGTTIRGQLCEPAVRVVPIRRLTLSISSQYGTPTMQSEQSEPVTDNETYRGRFEYERRSTRRPYYARQMGVIEGTVRVIDGRVSIYENTDNIDSDREEFVLSMKAGPVPFVEHEHDINWTTDRTLVVGGAGYEKLVVKFHRLDE